MFAQRRRVLHVKFIERHDPIDRPATRDVADRVDQILQRNFRRRDENLLDGLARPIRLRSFSTVTSSTRQPSSLQARINSCPFS